jgi:hypothetical protein
MRGKARIATLAIALMIARSTEGQSAESFEVASVRMRPPSATGKASWSDPGGTTFTAT